VRQLHEGGHANDTASGNWDETINRHLAINSKSKSRIELRRNSAIKSPPPPVFDQNGDKFGRLSSNAQC
jgi:hypothetical protein